MADSTLSLVTEETNPSGTDKTYIVTGAGSRRTTLTNLTKGLAAATTALSGIVELATSAETTTGTDTARATTPAGVQAVADVRDTNLANHLNDTADAHDASAISVLDAGTLITATDVEGALAELATAIATKLASSSYTAADVLAKLLTVDGAASGLDADLLDGQSSAYYATAASVTALIGGATAAGDTLVELEALISALTTVVAAKVAKADYNANTILIATADDTPTPLTVGASTIVGRKASGDISAMTGTETAALFPAASTTQASVVELATDGETTTLTDTARAVTPSNLSAFRTALDSRYVPKATYPWSVTVALSDMTTQITTGTTKAYWVNPFDTTLTVTKVKATLATAGSGSTVVDVNEGAGAGTTILSTKITIDASETDSDDATTPPVISDATIAADGRITFDIDTAGTSAAGLQVTLIGTRVLA
jgi:hypothetical protein